jgi:phage shock protein A
MFQLLLRTWHYSAAVLTSLFNAHADPRIQIEQAIEEAKQQHLRLTDQAAAVIGNEREIQIKIARGKTELKRLEASAAQALHLAEAARSKGETQRAAGFENSAQLFATQLAGAESSLTDLQELHGRAELAAGAAQRALEQNRFQLQRQLAERSKLLTDLEAARMQERMADALRAIDGLTPAGTTPTLPELRERIDQRIGRGAGRMAIARDGVESRMVEVERAVIDSRGSQLLEEIRRREGLAPAKEE